MFSSSFLFFKQMTAYEMRISDLSSDVCSSDLLRHRLAQQPERLGLRRALRDHGVGYLARLKRIGQRLLHDSGKRIARARRIRFDQHLPLMAAAKRGTRGRQMRQHQIKAALGEKLEAAHLPARRRLQDRKSTRLNSSH